MVFTSIHEVMIHSEDSADPRKLKEVLAETVEETTPEEDFLTYYVYHYNAETGQFQLLLKQSDYPVCFLSVCAYTN